MLKNALIVLLVGLVAIQFFKPEKNISDDNTFHVSTKYAVPDDVNNLLKVACNDCHTNKTEYPWYTNIQPVAWWLDHHVVDGKKHYNLSTFTKLPIAVQNHKFEETVEMLEKKEMPLESYTYLGLHKEANISEEQRQTLINWAKAQMDTLKANYPADSLKMKPRPGSKPKS
jgi:Haem-binding domain